MICLRNKKNNIHTLFWRPGQNCSTSGVSLAHLRNKFAIWAVHKIMKTLGKAFMIP